MKEVLNIAFPYFATDPNVASGTQRIHEFFRSRFSQKGHNIYLLDCTEKSRAESFSGPGNYFHIPLYPTSSVQSIVPLLNLFQNKDIDILIPFNSHVLTSAIPYLPEQTKIVMHCNSINQHAYYYVTRHLDRTSAIIVESIRQKIDLIDEWGVPSSKLRLIPLGVEKADDPTYPRRDTYGQLKIVFIGTLFGKTKGVDILPAVVRGLESRNIDYNLEIIGTGQDELTLRKSMGKFSDRVIFTGVIPNSAVRTILSSKHILIMPSRIEGFGLVAIEAMMAGVVPIVGNVKHVLDWIVTDNATGFILDSSRPQLFSATIARLDRDRELLQKISKQASVEASIRFSLDKMIDAHLALFYEVCGESQPRQYTVTQIHNWTPLPYWNPNLLYKFKWRVVFIRDILVRFVRNFSSW